MPRVKRGVIHAKKRRNLLKRTKGYRGARKSHIRAASTAVKKAGAFASAHRRKKKGEARRLWQIQLNAAVRERHELTYSKLIHLMKKKQVELDRKVLADLANNQPKVFDQIIELLKK